MDFLRRYRVGVVKLPFTADILPIKQAAIFSKVSGYIRKIHVERGDLVKDGQLLIEELGYDLRDARDLGRQVTRTLQEVPGVSDPFISREENYPQYDIVVDREKAAMAGLSQRDIAQAALISLASNVSLNPSIFTDPRAGNQYNVVVQLDEPYRSSSEDLSRLFVIGDGGRPVSLGSVAEVSRAWAR